ncbi:tyrosine-type recombinase/integrase [Bacillus thuringiensis]|uniref:tyrosine-type recombinase/integrase n=1 Tax=Bacillus thuringiensis TaxID=1428 RepID=UPI003CF548EE
MQIDSLFHEFELYMQESGRRPSTIKTYKYDVLLYLKWLESNQDLSSEDLKSITTNDIELYLESISKARRYAKSTLKQKYIAIKSFLDYYSAVIEINKIPTSKLKENNFANDQDINCFLNTLKSSQGLSEKQAAARPYIINRNTLIIHLMLHYGLSMNDIETLTMNRVNLGTGVITPGKNSALPRQVQLSLADRKLLFSYYKEIPEILRPELASSNALFIAFDYARKTFHWDYEQNAPKPLTRIAIQTMIRKESKRANVRITATSLRNRFILNSLRDGVTPMEIKQILGLKSPKTLYPYIEFYNELLNKQRIN